MCRSASLALLLVAALAACGGEQSDEVVLSFRADTAAETYECFGFDARFLEGTWIRALHWETPDASPVLLHHAGLFALPGAPIAGPVPCDAMPEGATALHVWAPGAGDLELPADVALAVPPDTRSLVVQAHALRVGDADAGTSTLTVTLAREAPAHEATWRRADAPVPAIGPHATVDSTATCMAASTLHVLTTRPHMHRVGMAFHASVVRADGSRAPFVDVEPWTWDAQQTYPVDVTLAPGDGIETTCTWMNSTDALVQEGLRLEDEMCQQGLVLWPADVATWTGPCE